MGLARSKHGAKSDNHDLKSSDTHSPGSSVAQGPSDVKGKRPFITDSEDSFPHSFSDIKEEEFAQKTCPGHQKKESDDGSPIVENVWLNRRRYLPAIRENTGSITQNQIKLRGVLQSLIESERNYITYLERLTNDYKEPIVSQIKKSEVKVTFQKIDEIASIHKMFQIEFSEKLKKCNTNENIGSIFHVFSQQMVVEIYSDYMNHYEAATEHIRELENSKQSFKKILMKKQMESQDRFSLQGLMLKPVQRFPEFIRIIKDLLKYSPRDHHDWEPLQEAVTWIESVVHQLNERKSQSEQHFHVVVDEQNSRDSPSDEKSYVDQTEDREEYDTYVHRRYLRKHTVRSMKKGELPDQRLLNELCLEFGRKSKLLVYLCHNICEHIKAQDENILHVWAAYTVKDRNKITFVVVVKENVQLEKTIMYSFIKRVVNEYSLEAEQVMYSNKEVSIDQNDLQRLKTSICNHATDLMRRHKYLSIISGSSVRSRNYGIDQAEAIYLIEQHCIVLYVHTKHFIPIEEEPFEELYDDVPVDVREGEFFPYVFATDHHEKLKHSCQIGSSPDRSPNDHNRLAGSLGCFIDHPEYNLCGLTCAHVLLFPWGLEKVKRDENGTLRWPSFKPHDVVYQPAGSNEAIGQIVQVIYQEGGNNSCGLEVALFQIDQRKPIAGHFPTMRNAGGDEEMVFDSGKSCGFSHIGDDEAIKFGPVTDKTTGRFELETHTTCVKTISEYWDYHQFRITLNNQLCVKSADSNGQSKPFAAEGDSGSLVFIKDSLGELVSVGIVEGGTSYGATIVTPIKPILQKLGVHSIKSFEKEKIAQKLDNIPNEIDNRLKDFKSAIDVNIQKNLNDFKTSLFTEMSEYLEKKLGGSN